MALQEGNKLTHEHTLPSLHLLDYNNDASFLLNGFVGRC